MSAPDIPVDTANRVHAAWNHTRQSVQSSNTRPLKQRAEASSAVARAARRALRLLRNTVIGLSLLTSIPVAYVLMNGDRLLPQQHLLDNERISRLDGVRQFQLPRNIDVDATTTGVAFRNLQANITNSEFRLREFTEHNRPWRGSSKSALFPQRVPIFDGPAPSWVLHGAVEGFTPEQLEFLRELAEAPIWHDFDRVATAQSIDMIGGRFVLPFPQNASEAELPTSSFRLLSELGHASVSRAAYYMAIGDHARAEHALRSALSFGFALIDNGTGMMDGLIGAVIVGSSRDALQSFYQLTNQPIPPGLEMSSELTAITSSPRLSVDELIRIAEDESRPRPVRYESLRALSYSSCTTVRGMFFGMDDDVRAAFAEAGATLARTPAEQAHLELMMNAGDNIPVFAVRRPGQKLVVGAATVVGKVLNNRRIAGCTRMGL